jgi:hypothetical protein
MAQSPRRTTQPVRLECLEAWMAPYGLNTLMLSEESGVAAITVLRAERGDPIGPRTARKLAAVFDVTVEDLMGFPPD